MAVNINPIKLSGAWDDGYALDKHTIQSIRSEDAFGNYHFDTTYTPIGKLLYGFKYCHCHENLEEIVSTIVTFLINHPEMTDFEAIIPVPPTNKERDYQPTFEIGRRLAEMLNKFFISNVLEKTSQTASKTLSSEEKESLNGTIIKVLNAKRKTNILLIDDLYDSGYTITECVKQLRTDPLIQKILVLTITKTKDQS